MNALSTTPSHSPSPSPSPSSTSPSLRPLRLCGESSSSPKVTTRKINTSAGRPGEDYFFGSYRTKAENPRQGRTRRVEYGSPRALDALLFAYEGITP